MRPLSLDARLLRLLRENPGGDIAEKLGVPPESARDRIRVLREAGYAIEDNRLIAAPDRLIADDILSRLDQPGFVREIIVFEETGSTNDVAAQLGRGGAAEGLVVFAERQTSGRGRLGRRWESSAGRGLWFSLLARPQFSMRFWPRLTTWAAVAVARGIEDSTPCEGKIKWPNDIYVAGKKAAGILTETQMDGNPFAVAGIGVNINQEAADFPDSLHGKAGSLLMAAGRPLDRMEIAAKILRRLDAAYPLIESGFEKIVAEARARSFLEGRWVEIGSEQGVVEGLDEEGGLLLRKPDGRLITLRGGEATPAGEKRL